MKKLLCFLIAFSMLLSCAPVMAQRNISLNDLPDVKELIYADSFTDTQNQRIVLGGEAEYNSGEGNITLTKNGDNASIYFNRNKTDIAGVYAVDLTLTRDITNNGEAWIYFGRDVDGERRQMDIRWKSEASNNDNHVTIYNRVTDGSNVILADSEIYGTSTILKLTVKFDTVSGKCSIWVNEKLAAEDNTTYFLPSSLQFVKVTTEGYNENTDAEHIRIEDFKVYSVPVEGMPIPDELYSHYTFDADSEDVTNAYPISIGGSSTLKVEKGALYVTNPVSGGGNAARVLVTQNKSVDIGYAGQKLFVEYIITSTNKPSDRALTNCVADPTRTSILQNLWNNGNIKSNSQTIADSEYGTQYSVKYTYLFDTLAKKYSLWINDKEAFTNVDYFAGATTGTIWAIYFAPGVANCALEDLKVGVIRDFVPDKYNVLFKEEFNSAEELATNTKLTMTEMKSNYTWGGSQVTAQASDTTQPYTRAVVKLDKKDIKGNIYLNFVVGRKQVTTANQYARLFFAFAKDEAVTAFDNFAALYWTDGAFYLNAPSPVTSTVNDGWITSYSATASLDCVFKFDVTNGKQSLYVNGKAAYENQNLSDAQKGYLANGAFRISLGNMEASKPLYIRHLEIWQDNGENSMRLTNDNKVEFIVNEDINGSAFYVAGYDAENSMEKLSASKLNIKKGKVYSADISDFSAFNKIKTFLWENDSSIKPLVKNTEK